MNIQRVSRVPQKSVFVLYRSLPHCPAFQPTSCFDWVFLFLVESVKHALDYIRTDASRIAKDRNVRSRAYLDDSNDPHGTKLYKIIRGDHVKKTSTMITDEGSYTSNTKDILQGIQEAWKPVYNRHAASPPQFADFSNKYKQHFHTFTPAPEDLPPARDMHCQAQRARPRVTAGIDGWLPVELKALPMAAWTERSKVFNLSIQLQTFPQDYEHVTSPCLPKKG